MFFLYPILYLIVSSVFSIIKCGITTTFTTVTVTAGGINLSYTEDTTILAPIVGETDKRSGVSEIALNRGGGIDNLIYIAAKTKKNSNKFLVSSAYLLASPFNSSLLETAKNNRQWFRISLALSKKTTFNAIIPFQYYAKSRLNFQWAYQIDTNQIIVLTSATGVVEADTFVLAASVALDNLTANSMISFFLIFWTDNINNINEIDYSGALVPDANGNLHQISIKLY